MRKVGNSRNNISATPRQLESLIRLSEARARLRFSEYVEIEDVEEAIRLIKVATQKAATDPETGKVDMDLINTGTTISSRIKTDKLCNIINLILRDYEDQARKGVKFMSLFEEVKKKIVETQGSEVTYTENDFREALRSLENESIVTLCGNRKIPVIRLIGFKH